MQFRDLLRAYSALTKAGVSESQAEVFLEQAQSGGVTVEMTIALIEEVSRAAESRALATLDSVVAERVAEALEPIEAQRDQLKAELDELRALPHLGPNILKTSASTVAIARLPDHLKGWRSTKGTTLNRVPIEVKREVVRIANSMGGIEGRTGAYKAIGDLFGFAPPSIRAIIDELNGVDPSIIRGPVMDERFLEQS